MAKIADMKAYARHYEQSVPVKALPENVFAYTNDHKNFSSHMNQPSWMMAGGSMRTETDEGKGQRVGSHIRMSGNVFGVALFLDEVITKYEPPHRKAWETVGKVNLLVIDQYKLGFEITPRDQESDLRVYIDYDLPKSWKTRLLGKLFGGMYAKWCVSQMTKGTREHFDSRTQRK